MKIPISWLKDYVDIDCDVKTLAAKMTMSGSKVEVIEHLGEDITGVVVGRIVKIWPHPNADKLVVTSINIGGENHVQIVTGATNIAEGDYVPVALHGANLANGLKIKKGKIRGELSDGMLCSIEELGYSCAEYPEASEDGIYIFQAEQTLGTDARIALGMLDDVIEFEITSNRADCYSVVGLAREAAATLDMPLRLDDLSQTENADSPMEVEIKNTELCPRYIAKVVKNVKIGSSPQWLRRRLIAAGLRPLNNIVDITNYVMLEYGQPMHAFDIGAIEGHIVVRNAIDGEKITSLDGEERLLDASMLVIADTVKAVGIAGVMGGEFSKINDDTTTILFESANFSGPNIRQTAKKLGLRTDSSAKYEKGLDSNLSLVAINRACQLVTELCCGDVVPGKTDVYPNPRFPHKITFDHMRINALLGTNISSDDTSKLLQRVGIDVQNSEAVVPTWRSDVQIWEDLAEEVARLYGYDNIPTAIASSSNVGGKNDKQIFEQQVADIAISLGFSQALTYAFESPKSFDALKISSDSPLRNAVCIKNPLGEDTSVMRTLMLNSMLASLATNYAKRNEAAALFEIAKVYRPTKEGGLPYEAPHLAMGYYGNHDFFHIKGAMEAIAESFGVPHDGFKADSSIPFFHPGRCGRLYVDGEPIATCGQIHPSVAESYEIGRPVYILVFYLDKLFPHVVKETVFKPLPRFPEAHRDIAVVVNEKVTHGEIAACIRASGGKYLKNISLFDVYRGKNLADGTKSIAYSLAFRTDDRTLTDEEVTKAVTKILAALEIEFDAKLRG